MEKGGSNTGEDNNIMLSQDREQYVEDHVSVGNYKDEEMTDTELSQDMFYEGVRKKVMKSVKRKQMRQTIRNNKKKMPKLNLQPTNGSDDETGTRATSRSSIHYFHEIIRHVRKSEHRIHLVQDMGFGELLQLDNCIIPRPLAQFIADNTSVDTEEIVFGNKSIPIIMQSVKDVLDLPSGDLSVDGDEVEGKNMFLALFGLTEVPKISYFGDKIKYEELDDDVFSRCFMGVTLGTFLCPNSSTKIGTKYLGALVDVDKIKDRNWCKFVYEWLIFYIMKYLKDKRKGNRVSSTLGGCIYHTTVRYLDFKDFGIIKLPYTLPRIRVWKGDLIKIFSDMDLGKSGKYGALPIKDIVDTCYAQKYHISDSKLRESIEEIVGNSIADTIKDDIIKSFQNNVNGQDTITLSKAHELVLDVLRNIKTGIIHSEDTLKIESSGGNQNSNETINESGSTEKVPEDNDDDFQAEQELRRKRRKLIGSSSSQHSSTLQVAPKSDDVIKGTDLRTFSQKEEQNVKVVTPEVANENAQNEEAKASNDDASFSSALRIKKDKLLKQDDNDTTYANINFDGFVKNGNCITLIAEQYGGSDDSTNAKISRAEYLKEAAKKYYFKDPSIPSFRLLENEDDNRKYMEEPELWRPVGTNSYCQDMHIKDYQSGSLDKSKETINEDRDETNMHDAFASGSKLANESDYDSTIQCAQRQTSYSYHVNSPEPGYIKSEHSFVDLVSPEPPSHGIFSQSKLIREEGLLYGTQSPRQNQRYSSTMLPGRKLFGDDEIDLTDNENNSPQRQIHQDQHISLEEVQILGEKKFKSTCSNMCDKTDLYYNQQLVLGSSTSSSVKWVVSIDNCRVSMLQVGQSFKPNGWVESYVINTFCRKLFRDKHPKISKKHYLFHTVAEYFLEKWPNEYMMNKWKQNTLKGFHGAGTARPLHLADRLYFPSLYESHYFVFVVDLKNRNFVFLDSAFGKDSTYHKGCDKLLVKFFVSTWYESGLKTMDFKRFDWVLKTGNDCGIYAMKLMELWCPRNPTMYSFSSADIPGFRIKLGVDTIFNNYNSADEWKMFIQNFNPKLRNSRGQ